MNFGYAQLLMSSCIRITSLIYLSMVVFLIAGISGGTDSNSVSKSGIIAVYSIVFVEWA